MEFFTYKGISAGKYVEGEIESLERKLLLDEYSDLLNSSLSPTSGHKDSIVTLIEFYDYQCSPCKVNYQEVEKMRASFKVLDLNDVLEFGPNTIGALYLSESSR